MEIDICGCTRSSETQISMEIGVGILIFKPIETLTVGELEIEIRAIVMEYTRTKYSNFN